MIKPHGSDTLNPLLVTDEQQRLQLLEEAQALPSIVLNSAAAANAVMLGAGYFNPLTGYMNLADSLSVADNFHTGDGLFWPVPVVNLVEDISAIAGATRIALRDPNTEGNPVMAIMDLAAIETVTDTQINMMAEQIFATLDPEHPGVATFTGLGRHLLSGNIQVLSLSYFQADFPDTFRTAGEIRNEIAERGWQKVVAFQTRNPCTERMKSYVVWPWNVWMPMVLWFICCWASLNRAIFPPQFAMTVFVKWWSCIFLQTQLWSLVMASICFTLDQEKQYYTQCFVRIWVAHILLLGVIMPVLATIMAHLMHRLSLMKKCQRMR